MAEPQNRREWHLDKTVSVTHIFSTIAAIATLVVVGAQFNTRLSLVEQAILMQGQTETRKDVETAEFKREIKTSIVGISDKLDRLIERKK